MDAATVYGRRWAILAVLSLCLVISGLDTLVIAMAVPSIQSDLDGSASQLQWWVDGYIVAFGGLLMMGGALSDRFGHKQILLIGLSIMLGFSVGAAYSNDAGLLIAMRAGMGVGAAMVMPATLAVIKYVFPPEEQARAIAVWSGAAGIGIPLGPLVGGLLLEQFWWGSIFLINVPVVGIALIAGIALIPSWRSDNRRRLDGVGGLLSVLGLVSLVFGLIESSRDGWGSPATLVPLAAGLALIGAFVWWESRTSQAMLPLFLFRNRYFGGGAAVLLCQAFALFGTIFVLTQYLQIARQYDPLPAGVRLLAICTLVVSAPLAPKVVERIGVKLTVALGLAVIAGGAILMSGADVDAEGRILVSLALMGLGIGLSIAASVDLILGSAPREHAGTASAINDTSLQVGGALGVAVLGSVMTWAYRNDLPAFNELAAEQREAVRDSIGSAASVAGQLGADAPRVLAAAEQAFGAGLSATAITSAVAAAIGVVLALIIVPHKPLTRVIAERAQQGEPAQRPAEEDLAEKR